MKEDFIRNPFPLYKQIHVNEPTSRFLLPNGAPVWLITRYNDATEILSDPHFVTSVLKDKEQEQTPRTC
jgi:cytochrome P450